MDFEARYSKLNDAQRAAVDQIDGPIMVIAGPGTGKTELLAMRAANILKVSDALPENILCLTFTDAGAFAMKKRLSEIIGRDAYKVSVYTFHSFGQDIMSRYREYFYNGANFKPADDLARHKIITKLLDGFAYTSPLRSRMNGEYTSVKDIIGVISDFKRASLTPNEITDILDAVYLTVQKVTPSLSEAFEGRVSANTLDKLVAALDVINNTEEPRPVPSLDSFKSVLARSLSVAIDEAQNHPKTTPPLTAWKGIYMAKDSDGNQVLKASLRHAKMVDLCKIYEQYLVEMEKQELYDYDDMIMNLVHTLSDNSELKYDLQEKYQYIMVDEFQDTNLAQMRIIEHLIDNPVVEDTPNIMVVGDDDQAIYGFQGAEVGNIITFRDKLPKTKLVTLTENYRSTQSILDSARHVISQGENRLENRIETLDKTLIARGQHTAVNNSLVEFNTPHDERSWIAKSIRELLDADTKPNEIAVIGRKHSDLVALVSYMNDQNIPISYEHEDNVLDNESVSSLIKIAELIQAIALGEYDNSSTKLPEILTHPMWNIAPEIIWQISLAAHRDGKHWLEILKERDDTNWIYNWLIDAAGICTLEPLVSMLDVLMGTKQSISGESSPYKEYFFATDKLTGHVYEFSTHLNALVALRNALEDSYLTKTSPKLADLLTFVAECHKTETDIRSIHTIGEIESSVRLTSAHGSKGLEFNHVFVINATDSMWGESARSRSSTVYPPNLRIGRSTGDADERLRLFYVASTRARIDLSVTYAITNDKGKETLVAAFLANVEPNKPAMTSDQSANRDQDQIEHTWYEPLISIPKMSMKQYLSPGLETYMLSATHVNNFIDITNGGPSVFLLNNLLHFPSSGSANLVYGNIMHSVVQHMHDHVVSHGSLKPLEDILGEFEKQIAASDMTDTERRDYLQKGIDALTVISGNHQDWFNPNQKSELDFKHQNSILGEIRLNGKLDVVEFDKDTKSAIVTDYKSGSPLYSWEKGTEYQKIKAHKYRQQLLFYKLLVENSRDYSNYTVVDAALQFIDLDKTSNQMGRLDMGDFDSDEIDRFKQLVTIIWQHIMNLDFPDTSGYEPNIKGIRAFEEDLLSGAK